MFARIRSLLLVSLLFLSAPAHAAVPSTMAYQGLLTDGGGTPLPSGPHALAFALYDVPSGGSGLWTESHPSVPVVNGSFSVVLGSVNSLAGVPFDKPYWLGIAVDGGGELSPRIELASSPYALALRTPFAATTSDTTPTLHLTNTSGWEALEVEPYMEVNGTPEFGGNLNIFAPDDYQRIQLYAGHPGTGGGVVLVGPSGSGRLPATLTATHTGGGHTGILTISGGSGTRFAHLDGQNGVTGDPRLYMNGSASQFVVDTNKSGDAAVALPPNSVGPSEMSGMPGISQGHTGNSGVALNSASAISCISTTITTPAAGYVTVDASGLGVFFGTAGSNAAMVQVSQSATGPMEPNYLRLCGSENWPNANSQYSTIYTTRTYFLAAGTHTFHLIAQKTAAAGGTHMILNTIRATYIPSSYGPVTTAVMPGEETVFDRVEVAPQGPSVDGLPTSAVMIGDLRDLELRATRARADAERAERELAAARAEAEMESIRKGVLELGAKRSASAGAAR